MNVTFIEKESNETEMVQYVTYFEENDDHYYIEFKDATKGIDTNKVSKDNYYLSNIKDVD